MVSTPDKIPDELEEEPKGRTRKPSQLTDSDLERLYDESSSRILQERNDFFLPQIRDFVARKRWVNLRPEYQRRHRWDQKKQSRLIESLLMNVPVPPVFLYEKELNRYEVMDGQQRLASLLDFYDGKLRLTGLEAWAGLNEKKYKDLPPRLRRGLDRRRISAVVLLAESTRPRELETTDIRHEVFERLNTGGAPLNNQELRNCVYSGPFNDLIVRLAAFPLFRKMWGIPTTKGTQIGDDLRNNKLFQTMGDCQIVLRFFAFRNVSLIRGSVKRMLDQCMERSNALSGRELKVLESEFKARLITINKIFGLNAFQLPARLGDRHSRPLFDALMVAVDRLWDDRDSLQQKRRLLRKQLNKLLANSRTYDLIVGKPNTAFAVKARIRAVERAFRSALS
jgi:hypothetical protein